MPVRKITELEQREFSGEDIPGLFYVDNPYNVSYCVKMGDIMDWIVETAKSNGLTVEQKDGKIVFGNPEIQIGKYDISEMRDKETVWIANEIGEGGQFKKESVEKVIAKFFSDNF